MTSHFTDRSVLESFGTPEGVQSGEAHSWISYRGPDKPQVRVGVDLGEDNFNGALGHLVAAAEPIILILTHDDKDHIGGWDAFAPTGLDTLRELWIPYEWVLVTAAYSNVTAPDRIHGSPHPGSRTAADHLRTIFTSNPQNDQPRTLDDLIGDPPPQEPRLTLDQRDEMITQITIQADLAEDEDGFFSANPGDLVDRVMERAATLDGIIRSCLSADVHVRLFSVDHQRHDNVPPWKLSGSPGTATIANAVEVFPTDLFGPLTASEMVYALGLTVQNRRALCPVLWHHDNDLHGAALIWSDSPGSWMAPFLYSDLQEFFTSLTISTAPHHGSSNPAHDPAWIAIYRRHRCNKDKPLILVRAGGQGNQTTHTEYLNHPTRFRRCTSCRCSTPYATHSQTVTVTTNATIATITAGNHHCP